MLNVAFYDSAPEERIAFVVIAARQDGRWLYCRQKTRATYEIPGGHREPGETLEAAARRELYEETGVQNAALRPVCVYSVQPQNSAGPYGVETFGMLYFAEVAPGHALIPPAGFEMEQVLALPDGQPPERWTSPEIQPKLAAKIQEFLRAQPLPETS